MVRPDFPAPKPKKVTVTDVSNSALAKKADDVFYNDFDDAELTREILEAARKTNVSIYGVLKEHDSSLRDVSEGRSVRK